MLRPYIFLDQETQVTRIVWLQESQNGMPTASGREILARTFDLGRSYRLVDAANALEREPEIARALTAL